MNLANVRKAAALVLVAVVQAVWSALSDGYTDQEVVMTVSIGLAAVGTYIVPELPGSIATIAKTVVTFLVTGFATATLLMVGGLTGQEVLECILTAAAAIGLSVMPNKDDVFERAKRGALPTAA